MRHSTVLILATGASVLAHALVLSLPGWHAFVGPAQDDAGPLHATLVRAEPRPVEVAPPVAPSAAAQPPKPRPKPPSPTRERAPVPDAPPALALAAPAGLADGEPLVPVSDVPPAAEAIAEPEPVPSADPGPLAAGTELKGFSIDGWPERGSIRFSVHLGEGGFAVGEARHEWSHDRERYRMSVNLRTTGVVGMFRSFHYSQSSEGTVGREGLRPERFSVEQSRKTPASAAFDWKTRQVTMTRGEKVRVAELQPGDQDLLSLWHQIGIAGAVAGSSELNVISGREATPSTIEVMGPERVALPIGLLDTLRVRAEARNGSLTIDIWLARNYGMLPVRIRVVDDKGEVLDQQAVELRLSPPGSPENETGRDDAAGGGAQAAEPDMIELRAEDNAFAQPTIGN